MNRWIDLQPTAWSWLALFAGAMAIVYSILTYRKSLAAVGARWRYLLATLRVLAILLLVFMTFSPRLPQRRERSIAHRVAVLLDVSESMSVTDPRSSTADLIAIAQATGRIAPQPTSDPWVTARRDLASLVIRGGDQRRRREELEYARLAGRNVESSVKELAAESNQLMTEFSGWSSRVRAQKPPAPMLPRIDAFATALRSGAPADLARLASALDADLSAHVEREEKDRLSKDPALQKILDDVAKQPRVEIARTMMRDGPLSALADEGSRFTFAESLRPASTSQSSGQYTDVYEALSRLLSQQSGAALDAIILLSDGRNTGPTQRLPSSVSGSGIPVFPVHWTSGNVGPDISLPRIEAPATANLHETIPVRVSVRSRQLKGKSAEVILTDGAITQKRTIALWDSGFETVDFDLACETLGEHRIEASVQPLDVETVTQNNRAQATVQVRDDTTRVAMLSGIASWDAQYLRNALAQAKWVKLTDESAVNRTCDWTPDQILAQQAIVLANVPVAGLSREQIEAIDQLISTRSGGLLLWIDDPTILSAYAAHPVMSRWLPYRAEGDVRWQTWPGESGVVQIVPAPGADDVRWATRDPLATGDRNWLARSRMYRLLRLPTLKPAARALLIDRETSSPVVVESSTGTGRTMLLAVNEFWRWRSDLGASECDRFLRSMIRQIIEPAYNATDHALSLACDRTQAQIGQTIDIRARTTKIDPQHAVGLVQLWMSGELVETRSLLPTIADSGRYAMTLRLARPGEGELRFMIDGVAGDVRVPIHVSASSTREMADVTFDDAALKRIADATGGRLVPVDKISELPDEIERHASARAVTMAYDLWSSPWAMAAVVGLLCLEWAIRKMLGML